MSDAFLFFVDLVTDEERLAMAQASQTAERAYKIGDILERRRDARGVETLLFSVFADSLAHAHSLRSAIVRLRSSPGAARAHG